MTELTARRLLAVGATLALLLSVVGSSVTGAGFLDTEETTVEFSSSGDGPTTMEVPEEEPPAPGGGPGGPGESPGGGPGGPGESTTTTSESSDTTTDGGAAEGGT